METRRFKQLLESTMGDVKPLISDYKTNLQETKEIEEGFFGNFVKKINQNLEDINDVFSIVDLARKDEEDGAEKAVQMLMDKRGMSEEEAINTVSYVYEKFKPWITLSQKKKD